MIYVFNTSNKSESELTIPQLKQSVSSESELVSSQYTTLRPFVGCARLRVASWILI